MDKYVIKLYPRAYRDLDEIYAYIADILLESNTAIKRKLKTASSNEQAVLKFLISNRLISKKLRLFHIFSACFSFHILLFYYKSCINTSLAFPVLIDKIILS